MLARGYHLQTRDATDPDPVFTSLTSYYLVRESDHK